MGSRLRAFRSVVVVCLMCIGARPRSTSEANPVGTASPPVRRRCNSYVLLWWRVLLLLLHCGHIITVTWKSCAPRREPIPSGRSPAGFPLGMPQRTQTSTRNMGSVFAVHTLLLLRHFCQFRAWGIRLLARPLSGQPPLVRIGSSVLGATWHARCAEALAWRSTCVCPLSGPRSWTTAFPHALWHGSVCCIRCTHLPPVLSAARCLRLVSLLVGRPSRGSGGTERSATSPLPTPACSRLRFLVLLQDSPHHEGCILCLRVRRRAYRPKSMRTVYLLLPVSISLWCVARMGMPHPQMGISIRRLVPTGTRSAISKGVGRRDALYIPPLCTVRAHRRRGRRYATCCCIAPDRS